MELQKALEEVSDIQEKLDLVQSEIFSLRKHIDRGCSEKLALEHEIRVLRGSLESRDKDVEELRSEVSCQSDHYDDLWLAHRISLKEAQKLSSEVIALRSGVQVESTRGWLGARTGTPRVQSPRPGGSGCQPRGSIDRVESSESWHERSQRWSMDRGSGCRRG